MWPLVWAGHNLPSYLHLGVSVHTEPTAAAHPGAHPSPASVRLFYVQYEPPTMRSPLITDCIKVPVSLNFDRPSKKGDIELKVSRIFQSCIQYVFQILTGTGVQIQNSLEL